MIKTAVFDFDGTIHDTKRLYGSAFRKAYEYLVNGGYAEPAVYSDDDVSKYLGMTAPEMWRSFMPQLSTAITEKAGAIIGAEMIKGVLGGQAVTYEGITEALDRLRQAGCSLMILSNCRRSYMDAHRKALGLDKWFIDYFCGEEYGFIPKEDIFAVIMKKYPSHSFVMVGDRASDIAAGVKNGVPAVGCLYGFGSPDELAQASRTVSSPDELFPAIASILCLKTPKNVCGAV